MTNSATNSLAKTVKDVANLTNPLAKVIMDRSSVIDKNFVEKIVNQSIFSWKGRNPAPAIDENGNYQATDLDLLSFMVPMVARGAIIEIPAYKNRRKSVKRSNERKVGSTQFGAMTNLVSHKDALSFSVRIFDQSIIVKDEETEKESVGAFRNYMLVDCDGYWHDGWNQITWDPSKKENAFLSEKNLWTGNSVRFTHYVHPNRKQSIYGAPYLLLKMLTARLTDEASFYRAEVKRLKKLGITLPKGEKSATAEISSAGETEKITVDTIECILDLPEFSGDYVPVSNDVSGMIEAYRRQKLFTYTLKPLVQFVLRADEAAFFFFGHSESFIAHWMGDVSWESGYKPPRGRIQWNRLQLSENVALRYRIKSITQEVSRN